MVQVNFSKTIALEHQIRIVGGILIRVRISVSIHEVHHCLFYNRPFTILDYHLSIQLEFIDISNHFYMKLQILSLWTLQSLCLCIFL